MPEVGGRQRMKNMLPCNGVVACTARREKEMEENAAIR